MRGLDRYKFRIKKSVPLCERSFLLSVYFGAFSECAYFIYQQAKQNIYKYSCIFLAVSDISSGVSDNLGLEKSISFPPLIGIK